jgi:AAA family ATP:ADP antiporter
MARGTWGEGFEAITPPSTSYQLLRRVVDVSPGEAKATVASFFYFFFILSSYFVLRPIRDEMAVASGVRNLPYMFAGSLAAMLVANPIFAALVVRYPVRRFITITYQFFALNLVLFYLAARTGLDPVWTGRVFFVWTSVFNLFVPSVFWSFMADTFRSGQAKRLFGFIALGGTCGSIVGSSLTGWLARPLGVSNLLLVSFVLLEAAALVVAFFPAVAAPAEADAEASADDEPVRGRRGRAGRGERQAIGGSMWDGFTRLVQSPYLLAIGLFLILYTLGSTVLYFAQTEIIGKYYTGREARTEILARIELAGQTLTVITQAFLTARIIRVAGLAAALAIMPAISMIGFAALGASTWGVTPMLWTFMAFAVLRRASNFAITNPSMEILYTVVPRDDKYKAKSFIETFIYRAGDQLGAVGYASLAALGLTLAGISWVSVPLAAIFLALGVWLGRRQRQIARDENRTSDRAPATDATMAAGA